MANVTNEQLLAMILALQTQVDNIEYVSGGGSSSGMDATIATEIRTYLVGTQWANAVSGRTITANNAWSEYMRAINYMTNYFNTRFNNIDVPTDNDIYTLIATWFTNNKGQQLADYIKNTDVVFDSVTAEQLFARVGEFLSLVTQTVSAAGVQAFTITSDHLTIDDAFITNAMIANISANKITSGTISTNSVTISGDSGKMLIADGTITISDGTNVRVQIGCDANDDYNMVVADANGNVMWSALGLQAAAIKSAIITDDHIADNANISADKIDISSLITSIEDDGTLTIDKAQIVVDANNQTLSAWMSTLETWKTNLSSRTSTLETQVTLINGELDSFLKAEDLTTINNNITTLQTQYSNINQTVSNISTTVSAQSTTISGLQDDVDDLESDVSTAQTTANQALNTAQSAASGNTTNSNSITTLQSQYSTLDQTVSGFSTRIGSTEASITSLSDDIDELTGDVGDNATSIATLTTSLNSIDDAINNQSTGLSKQITDMQAQVSANNDLYQSLYNRTLLTQTDINTQLSNWNSSWQQTAAGFQADVQEQVDDALDDVVTHTEYDQHFTFDAQGMTISSTQSPVKLHLCANGIEFVDSNDQVLGYWDGDYLNTGNLYVHTSEMARFGDFAWVPTSGGLALQVIDDD